MKENWARIEESFWSDVAAPQAATMYWETPMPMAPVKRTGRRPNLSIATSPGKVDRTFTTFVIIVRVNAAGRADALTCLK